MSDLRDRIATLLQSELDLDVADPEYPAYVDGRDEAVRIADKIVALVDAGPKSGEVVAWHIQHPDGLVALRKPESVDDNMRVQATADGLTVRPLVFGDSAKPKGGSDAFSAYADDEAERERYEIDKLDPENFLSDQVLEQHDATQASNSEVTP